jgi:hypothetical protein
MSTLYTETWWALRTRDGRYACGSAEVDDPWRATEYSSPEAATAALALRRDATVVRLTLTVEAAR